jgi:hypothetical protein
MIKALVTGALSMPPKKQKPRNVRRIRGIEKRVQNATLEEDYGIIVKARESVVRTEARWTTVHLLLSEGERGDTKLKNDFFRNSFFALVSFSVELSFLLFLPPLYLLPFVFFLF